MSRKNIFPRPEHGDTFGVGRRHRKLAGPLRRPGLVRTEKIIEAATWLNHTNSESPEFIGRAVAALACDPNVMRYVFAQPEMEKRRSPLV
jgi:hypothetical protein